MNEPLGFVESASPVVGGRYVQTNVIEATFFGPFVRSRDEAMGHVTPAISGLDIDTNDLCPVQLCEEARAMALLDHDKSCGRAVHSGNPDRGMFLAVGSL
jgi:hypothetical protein